MFFSPKSNKQMSKRTAFFAHRHMSNSPKVQKQLLLEIFFVYFCLFVKKIHACHHFFNVQWYESTNFYQRTQNENGNMNNREETESKKKEAEQKHKRNITNLKTKQMIIIAGAFVSPSVVSFSYHSCQCQCYPIALLVIVYSSKCWCRFLCHV